MNTTEQPQAEHLTARMSTPVAMPGVATGGDRVRSVIMWMPAGTHRIRATLAGKGAVERTVQVTPDTARAMQQALLAETASGHRPLFDFDHAHGAAAGWPERYWWEDGRGVMVDVEWSDAGAAAIAGRQYRAFSPEFFCDADGRVTGAPKFQGSLVNDPAFKAIEPLWAANADNFQAAAPADPTTTTTTNMDKDQTHGGGSNAAAVTDDKNDAAVQAAAAEKAAIQAKLDEATKTLQAMRKEKAQAAVQAAVARGALPALDKALQASWAELIESDEAHLKLLDALPGNSAMQASATGRGTAVQAKPGLSEALKSYAAADATLRSSIYAREIAPALDKGEALGPILAANSLGTLSGELVTQRALSLLKLRMPVLSRVSTDFSGERAAFGQTIKTRLRAVPAATDYNATTGYATSDATTTDVPLTIDQHKAVQIKFGANELANTERDLFAEQAEGCQYALGKALVDALYAQIVATAFTNITTQAVGTFARTHVVAMAKALYERGVPEMGRFLLLNPAYFEKLQSDPTIVNLAAYQRPEVITDYRLPPIAGFEVLQAVNLPATGNLTGFAAAPDALALATRLPNDYSTALPGVTGGGAVSTVRNPDTGISVMLVQFVDHQLGAAFWRVALMFGTAVGNPQSGQFLRSSAP